MSENTKLCKHCKSEIPKDAKICPNCRKKQKGIGKWIVLAIIVILIIAIAAGNSGKNKNSNPEKISSDASQTQTSQSETSTDASTSDSVNASDGKQQNIFHAGDVIETENLRISFLSTGEYTSDNEFMQPKEGYVYWKFEFSFENISDHDEVISSLMDWECYADNTKVDSAWLDGTNGLDATLSPGRTTQGTLYFEVPANAKSIELEYKVDYLKNNKIIFTGK